MCPICVGFIHVIYYICMDKYIVYFVMFPEFPFNTRFGNISGINTLTDFRHTTHELDYVWGYY